MTQWVCWITIVASMLYAFVLTIFILILMPHSAYAWGPGVHIGVSLSALSQVGEGILSVLLANLNEYLYGALAPDFIVGKKYARKGHSHKWEIGFDILRTSKTDAEKAFAYGYLTHLASDAVAHGIMIPELIGDSPHKGARHFYIEVFADAYCDNEYKTLAKRILKKYNAPLDNRFKFRVDSNLFSFPVSKLIFKGFTRLSFNKKVSNVVLSRGMVELFGLHVEAVRGYVNLSKEFSVDVLNKLENSPVTKISAISR